MSNTHVVFSADITALAVLAGAAYAASPSGIIIDAGDDIRAVLTEMNGFLVVAVRGTVPTDLNNWLTDFNALPDWLLDVGVMPRGFCLASKSLMAKLQPHIAGRRMLLTGHSLGGAIAILLCTSLKVAGTPAVYTAAFGPPRTCRWATDDCIAEEPGLITHYGNDPVPEVPFPYRHPWSVAKIGQPDLDPIACHSITGVVAWLQQYPHQP